MQKKVYS